MHSEKREWMVASFQFRWMFRLVLCAHNARCVQLQTLESIISISISIANEFIKRFIYGIAIHDAHLNSIAEGFILKWIELLKFFIPALALPIRIVVILKYLHTLA